MVGSQSMGQAVTESILDEKVFHFLVCHTKQAKPKYWATTMPALLSDVLPLPFFAKNA